MNCDEIQQSLALYVDDGLNTDARRLCYQHLEVCPVCRAHVHQLRSLRSGLALLSKPSPPNDLIAAINTAIAAQAAETKARRNESTIDRINDWGLRWLQPLPTRYAFSSLASIIIFSCVFAALRPHMIALHEAVLAFNELQFNTTVDALWENPYDITQPISPESYAALRTPFNAQSPSLNPSGALATLGWQLRNSHAAERSSDDDMVIVADVFTNGSASLADVVQAPRDRRVLEDFQQALRKDPAFVPAALDRRPETMRVVFSVQRVDVHETNY